jgi:hypothetical protein
MHAKFEIDNEPIIMDKSTLETYDNIYNYKKKLEDRDIVFFINEEDLIKFNNDTSDLLYLRIIKDEQEKPINKTQIQLPRAITCPPQINKKITYQTQTKPIKSPKLLCKNIKIKNTIYQIYYRDTNITYSTFKIKFKNDKIFCVGTYDHKIISAKLISGGYDIKNIKHNDFNYEIFTPEFNGFVTPMFIQCMEGKISVVLDIFMNIFGHISINI